MGRGLGWVTPRGPFQPLPCWDSVKPKDQHEPAACPRHTAFSPCRPPGPLPAPSSRKRDSLEASPLPEGPASRPRRARTLAAELNRSPQESGKNDRLLPLVFFFFPQDRSPGSLITVNGTPRALKFQFPSFPSGTPKRRSRQPPGCKRVRERCSAAGVECPSLLSLQVS